MPTVVVYVRCMGCVGCPPLLVIATFRFMGVVSPAFMVPQFMLVGFAESWAVLFIIPVEGIRR